MTPGDRPVTAAPNRSRLTARVLSVEPSPRFADTWLLRIRVQDVQGLSGGTFAASGQDRDAVAFGPGPVAEAGDVIQADAEYVGGPAGGVFRLHTVARAAPPEPAGGTGGSGTGT
jgi:hypothetical protein